MKRAYSLLGLLLIAVFLAAYLATHRAYAPTDDAAVSPDDPISDAGSQSEVSGSPDDVTREDAMMEEMTLTLTTSAFDDGGEIPSVYTCDGENVNPELQVSRVPEEARTLALLMYDPDIPASVQESIGQDAFDHWVRYNIPADQDTIPQGEGDTIGSGGVTSRGGLEYVGPCPPDGEHRYIFELYALPAALNFITPPTLADVRSAAESAALEEATLIGRYARSHGE